MFPKPIEAGKITLQDEFEFLYSTEMAKVAIKKLFSCSVECGYLHKLGGKDLSIPYKTALPQRWFC